MIESFITKCNFDQSSVLVKVGDTSINIDDMKIYHTANTEDDGYFSYTEFDKFCFDNKLDKIDFLSISSVDYNKILNSELLHTTQYIYLEYYPPEDRNSFSLPGEGWNPRFDTGQGILFENFVYLETLIKQSGAWNNKNVNEHLFDSTLAYCILNFLQDNKTQTCVDFGCGDGSYTKYFNENNIITKGYDGNPFTPEITDGLCSIIDLSAPFNLKETYDCVMSLEVGEHIPKRYEQIFIQNLIDHSHNLIILSWAIPGQGGHGHVNCADNSYIKDIFKAKHFLNRLHIENILRQSATYNWFHNTIMVFQRVK